MKTVFKLLSVLFVVMFVATSCSKDDDPADNDLFIGTYSGQTSYTVIQGDGNSIEKGDGKVIVTKVGDSYNFSFNRDIPNINGIKMEKGENNKIFFSNELGSISIDAGKLSIVYARDGKAWFADCSR